MQLSKRGQPGRNDNGGGRGTGVKESKLCKRAGRGTNIINDGVDHLPPSKPFWRLGRFSFGAHELVALAHAQERVAGR